MKTFTFTTDADTQEVVGYFTRSFYHKSAVPLIVITVILAWLARPSTTEEIPKGFRKFQAKYLVAWVFCVASDWLQGPYVYALYAAYGFPRHEIAKLFVAGFAAALVFSGVAGSLCDRFGRKRSVLAYVVLYIVSCLTKHVKLYWVLLLGRITGGFATSLLFSCFEAWMVSEHVGRHGFSSGLLGYMFGVMYTSMYLVAIVTGFVGEALADGFKFQPMAEGSVIYRGGDLGPFDLAILCLVVGGLFVMLFWEENYGSDEGGQGEALGMLASVKESARLLFRDRRVLLLCCVVACFESSMYAFVFNWTPALDSKEVPPPYGLIFSLYMMACMCGASVSTITSALAPASRLASAFVIGIAVFVVAAKVVGSSQLQLIFAAFVAFEFSVGVYFPSVGVLKSEVVPERVRGTMYNIYRVPLNAIVVALLLTNLSTVTVYAACAVLLGVSLLAVCAVMAMPKAGAKKLG